MNLTKAVTAINLALKANLPIFLQGSPGVGKSSIIKRVADDNMLEVIDLRLSQCDITDLNGLPKFENGKAAFQPFDVFPLKDTPIPAGKQGWLLFLDELNAAQKPVQVAAYKLILDRMVGNHHLHNNLRIVCAGNLATDNAVVEDLSSALRSRLITITIEADTKEWLDWADKAGIDYRITAYLEEKPDSLFKFDPERDDGSFPCPRTWEMLSKIIKQIPDVSQKNEGELLRGIIGNTANEFIEYCKYASRVPKYSDIIAGKAKIDPDSDLGIIYMTLGSLIANINATSPATDTECKNIVNCLNTYGNEYLVAFNSRLAKMGKHTFMLKFPSYMKYITTTVREAING